MNVSKLLMYFCLLLLICSCGPEAESPDDATKSDQEPVGIILNPRGNLPGMDIAAVLTPDADHRKLAEALSLAFHNARAACEKTLAQPSETIQTIEGITVFQGKLSVRTPNESDGGVRCLAEHLNGQTLTGFGEQTHMLDIQLRLRSAK